MKKNLSFILFYLFIPFLLNAQSYYFRNYQVSNGVSSNTITCITQDKKGFMWFGTRNGLNRFDGSTFKIFRKDDNDSLSIGNNSILSLFEDKNERLWVGTYKGIYLYDEQHEKFTLFDKMPQVETRYISSDNSGNIWLVAAAILYKFNTVDNSIKTYPYNNSQTPTLSISEKGVVWSATVSGLVRKYDTAKDAFVNYDIAGMHKKSSVFIQTIYPITDTTILLATLNEALLFNIKTLQLTNVFNGNKWAENIQVHKIIRQSANTFWFGTENGLYILDLATGASRLIQKQYADPYSINDNVITDFWKDREGSTWVGTFFGGINYYSPQLNRFQKYFPLPGTNSLSGNLVHEICADKKDLWIGTEDAGLNKLDIPTGKIKQFMPGQGAGSITYQNIHGLLADGDKLWIGTYEHGLDVMDLKTEKVIKHYGQSSKPNSLNSNFIVTIYKRRNGDILIGTWGGLFKYNRSRDNFDLMPYFNREAQAIHEDGNGTLWVCSYGKGVYYNNEKTGVHGNLTSELNNVNSLPSNYVNNLLEDKKGNLWFCTESGFCKYDALSKKIVRFSNNAALADNQVFKALEDENGMIWISTSKGLVSLNPVNNETKIYTTANGLLSDQFNYNSGYKSSDGKLYFGSVKGMVSFDPSTFSKSTFVPPVFIVGLQVNNKETNLRDERSPLSSSIITTKRLTLPYDQSSINLDVKALSYTVPELNRYLYRMDGYDKEWTLLTTNRKIYYTQLPTGNYTFRIKGSSGSGVWNTNETILLINVSPPIWESIWAYILYVLIALAIVFLILRYYYIALREKNKRKIDTLQLEKEREIYNAKVEFFTNIAHEIRTPLTLIKLPLDKLIGMGFEDHQVNESLNTMKKNTSRLIGLTNQLLDFRKAEANKFSLSFVESNINELLTEAFTNLKPAAEQKSLIFRLEMPRIALNAYVDMEALKKILTNLINNAIKYSDRLVMVKLLPFGSEDLVFNIEIKNDGYLIPYELKEKIFEPFYRIKETDHEPGTGIGLPLARTLAELHKGVLDLQKPVDQLNIFRLTLPIHQENEINLSEKTESEYNEQDGNDSNVTDPQKLTVLLVEDNKEILDFLSSELKANYNIIKSVNGKEALSILEKESVQLVISDIMMPIMDGIELCRIIKTDLQYSHVPIILLTAKNTLHSKIEGLEVGADAYIEKPFAFEHLKAQITNLINNRTIIKDYFARSPLTHLKGIASTKADSNFLEELNKAIYDNITDMELDVDGLSRMMNMSRPTLYRKIKALSNLTPNELINISRLKKAAELLAEGKYKMTEVANMVGYTLASNFSRDFNKQFGMTPSSYLASLRAEIKS